MCLNTITIIVQNQLYFGGKMVEDCVFAGISIYVVGYNGISKNQYMIDVKVNSLLSLFQEKMNKGYLYGNSYRFGYSLPKTSAMPDKWPQDIQCVHPSKNPNKGSIYVSNVEAASNHLTLSKFNIKAVMTCARGHDRNIPKSKLEMFQYFPFDDRQTCDLSPYFQRACDWIANASQKTNVLVHCIAGVSRSVSMVLAYLIRDKGMTYDQAYHNVKLRRKIICPNQGFIKQLKQFANKIKTKEIENHRLELTPKKQNMHESSKFYSNFNTNKSITQQKLSKYKNILNEQDTEIHHNQSSAYHTNPSNSKERKATMTPSSTKKDYKSFANSHNISTIIPKSSPLIQNDRTRTPENKAPSYHQAINLELTSKDNAKTNYFKQMSQELNEKIDEIHAKYEKKREELISKRGYSTGYTRENSKYYDRSAEYRNTKDAQPMKSKLQKAKNFPANLEIPKYQDFYQNSYQKPTKYGEIGRLTASNYYKNKYY